MYPLQIAISLSLTNPHPPDAAEHLIGTATQIRSYFQHAAIETGTSPAVSVNSFLPICLDLKITHPGLPYSTYLLCTGIRGFIYTSGSDRIIAQIRDLLTAPPTLYTATRFQSVPLPSDLQRSTDIERAVATYAYHMLWSRLPVLRSPN